ncbi:hypothetical protein AB0F72_09435 [Actinoplanes sp. NPDC023936]|uniref:hypothetical protein n=1 Tax=Actinoplanes sp. NPDC023936 TaxID=3154910 RepID=UPI0033EFB941
MSETATPEEALARLTEARTTYAHAETAFEKAREDVIGTVVTALRAGVPPTVVATTSGFTAAYVRKIARDHGIEPAKPGIKPGMRPKPRKPGQPPAMRTS